MKERRKHGLDPWQAEKVAKDSGLFDRGILPNQPGYKFHGFGLDGTKYNCEIQRNKRGMHYITGEATYSEIVGWMPLEASNIRCR